MSILLEDFVTIDLKSYIGKVNPKAGGAKKPATDPAAKEDVAAEEEAAATGEEAETTDNQETKKTFAKDHNWEQEYASRVEENKKRSADSQLSEDDLDIAFFKDFFGATFDKDIAEHLVAIDLVRDDFKALKFGDKNPLLTFFKLDYVQKTLLKTKLINEDTMNAIHKALVNKIITPAMCAQEVDYNILYCADLYQKSASEMYKYFEKQRELLDPGMTTYNNEEQLEAKRAMFDAGLKGADVAAIVEQQKELAAESLPSALDSGTKLNSLAFIDSYLGLEEDTDEEADSDDEETKYHEPTKGGGAEVAEAFKATFRKDVSTVFVAIQAIYLAVPTKTRVIKDAMNDARLTKASAVNVAKASITYAALLKKASQMKQKVAEDCVKALLATLK